VAINPIALAEIDEQKVEIRNHRGAPTLGRSPALFDDGESCNDNVFDRAFTAVVIQNAARGSRRDCGELSDVVSAHSRSRRRPILWFHPEPRQSRALAAAAKRGPTEDERYKSVK
jgi:hypothetical protein